jgi:cell division protein ZapD
MPVNSTTVRTIPPMPKHERHFQSVEPYGRHQTVPENVIYEQPLNERIRTLLRLEFLFEQANAHIYRHSIWDNRAAISALFDLVNIFSRADLKTEIMKELERQALFLEKLAKNPQVDSKRLEKLLDEMDVLIDRLYALKAQDMDIRGNEFLSSIKQRNQIAGGTCDFDLPAYHFWLSQPEEKRILDLQHWLEPFDAINQSVNLILRLVRDSAHSSQEVAESGFYQQSLDANTTCQLIRVTLKGDTPYFAEISGGKHRFTIRFMQSNFNERPSQTDKDVSFLLTCCMLL